MKNYSTYFCFFLLVWFSGCNNTELEVESISGDFNDPALQKVINFQNQQNTDSLLSYLNHPSANIRYYAALAFGSINDTTLLNPLSVKLNDEHPMVRAAAAFSVGQSKLPAATNLLVDAFDPYDTSGVYGLAHSYILEAVGKCGDESTLDLLTGISTYQKRDTLLLTGQIRGIYQFALQGITSPVGTQKMIDIVSDENYINSVRLVAANYLSRSPDIDLSTYAEVLSPLIFREEDPNIRMALVIALGKTKQSSALAALEQRFKMEGDYRVKCNIIRSFRNFEYEDIKATLENAVLDPNPNISLTAAQFCRDRGISSEASTYWRLAKDSVAQISVPILYAAAQRHLPIYYEEHRQGLNGELRRLFRESNNEYEQAGFLSALAEFGWNYRFIQKEGFNHESAIVKSTSARLLANILEKPNFRTFFGVNYRNVRRELAVFMKDAIRSNDIGMINPAARSLSKIGAGPRNYLIQLDSSFIKDALVQLDLPREKETFEILLETAKVFNLSNLPNPEEQISSAREIDWNILSAIQTNPNLIIETSKGDIAIQLLPEIAPASASNFARLAKEGFYNNIAFHRVVPNFVIQAGCDRGDGNGGAPYNIRSELKPVKYDKGGYVGMARSTYHSESSQFFITHSPTLHLDSQYSLFGKLESGWDVLNNIQQGDRIISIKVP